MPQTWAPTPCPKQNEDCLNSIGIMCFLTYLIQIKTKNFYDMIDLILFIYFYLNMEHIIIILTCLATWRSIWPAATAFTAFWAYAPLQYRFRLLLRSEFLWWPVRASENKAQFLKQHFNEILFSKSYYLFIIFKILKSFFELTISVLGFRPPKKKKYILI